MNCCLRFQCLYEWCCKEINTQLLGRGLSLLSEDGREWNMNQLLFANDKALMADSQERLRQLVKKFSRGYERKKKIEVNVSRSMVMKCTRMADKRIMNVALKRKLPEELQSFEYFASHIPISGEIHEIKLRMNEV